MNIEEDSRMFREFMKNQLFRSTVRSLTHLETLSDGLTPAEIWVEVNNLLSELRSVNKSDREVMVSQFYINYYHKMRELERGGRIIPRSYQDVDRTVTCIFYCLELCLESNTTDHSANPNHELIEALTLELKTINHPVLDDLRRGISEDVIRYQRLPASTQPPVDPLEQLDLDWNTRLEKVFNHYSRRMERFIEQSHYESFCRLWKTLCNDTQVSEQMKVPNLIKGDEHRELCVCYNAKLLFNIYGMLYRRGYFLPSIKGETPLSIQVSEHFDAETGMKVSARYEYFKPESVKIKPQFLGAYPSFYSHIAELLEK